MSILGATHTEAIPHSLSWVKEPQMTASCFPDILPTDRNGTSQVNCLLLIKSLSLTGSRDLRRYVTN